MSPIETAIALVDDCMSDASITALIASFHNVHKSFGFEHAATGAWYWAGGKRVDRFFFNDWPEDWLDIYAREELALIDPIVTTAVQSMESFSFSDHRGDWLKQSGARRVIETAEAYGWREVYAVPLHGPFGYQGLVSLASFTRPTLSTEDRIVLDTAARAIHQRCRTESGFGVGLEPRAELTERQIECLRWVSAGKSDADIATLIGLAEATVHYHVEQAKKRLGVRSRVEAVARLILDGTL